MGHRNLLPCDPTLPQPPQLAAPRRGSVRRASGFVQAGFTSKVNPTAFVNTSRLERSRCGGGRLRVRLSRRLRLPR